MANIVLSPAIPGHIDRRRKDVDHASRPTNAAFEDRERGGGRVRRSFFRGGAISEEFS